MAGGQCRAWGGEWSDFKEDTGVRGGGRAGRKRREEGKKGKGSALLFLWDFH